MMLRARSAYPALFFALALLSMEPKPLDAQGGSDPQARAAADAAIAQLRSPYCPGRMLENCTSSQAGALRDSIHDLAAQGATTEELVEWMLARHGEEYRGVPQGRGAGLVAWIIPPLGVLAAIGLLVLWFRSSRPSAKTPAGGPPSALSEADRRELSEALRTWESSGDQGR